MEVEFAIAVSALALPTNSPPGGAKLPLSLEAKKFSVRIANVMQLDPVLLVNPAATGSRKLLTQPRESIAYPPDSSNRGGVSANTEVCHCFALELRQTGPFLSLRYFFRQMILQFAIVLWWAFISNEVWWQSDGAPARGRTRIAKARKRWAPPKGRTAGWAGYLRYRAHPPCGQCEYLMNILFQLCQRSV